MLAGSEEDVSGISPYEHLKVQIHKIHDLGRCHNVKRVDANRKKRSGRKIHYSPQKHGRQPHLKHPVVARLSGALVSPGRTEKRWIRKKEKKVSV